MTTTQRTLTPWKTKLSVISTKFSYIHAKLSCTKDCICSRSVYFPAKLWRLFTRYCMPYESIKQSHFFIKNLCFSSKSLLSWIFSNVRPIKLMSFGKIFQIYNFFFKCVSNFWELITLVKSENNSTVYGILESFSQKLNWKWHLDYIIILQN